MRNLKFDVNSGNDVSIKIEMYIGNGCGLNNWNSSVDGIGMVIVKIKSRKVSGSSIGCHKLVAAWVIASVS